jgi:hypothetical protein
VDPAHELLHVGGLTPEGGTEIRDLRRPKREQVESRRVFLTGDLAGWVS